MLTSINRLALYYLDVDYLNVDSVPRRCDHSFFSQHIEWDIPALCCSLLVHPLILLLSNKLPKKKSDNNSRNSTLTISRWCKDTSLFHLDSHCAKKVFFLMVALLLKGCVLYPEPLAESVWRYWYLNEMKMCWSAAKQSVQGSGCLYTG